MMPAPLRALMKINQDSQHTDDIGVAPQPTTIPVPPFANGRGRVNNAPGTRPNAGPLAKTTSEEECDARDFTRGYRGSATCNVRCRSIVTCWG